MSTKIPFIRRFTRHRELPILFRSAREDNPGEPLTRRDPVRERQELPKDQVKAALIEPSSQLPEGQVIDFWEPASSVRAIKPSVQARTQPDRFLRSAQLDPSGSVQKPGIMIEGDEVPGLETKRQPEQELDKQFLPEQPQPYPEVNQSHASDPPESESEEANWRRLETIFQKHVEAREESGHDDSKTQQSDPGFVASDPSQEASDPAASISQPKQGTTTLDSELEGGKKAAGFINKGDETRDFQAEIEISPKQEEPFELEKESRDPLNDDPQAHSTYDQTPLISQGSVQNQLDLRQPTTAGDREMAEPLISNDSADQSFLDGVGVSPPKGGQTAEDLNSQDPVLIDDPSGRPQDQQRENLGDLEKTDVGSEEDITSVSHAAPLEAAWPVQRRGDFSGEMERTPQAAPLEGILTASHGNEMAGEQTEISHLRRPAPGQATKSSIEVIPPRRPRPQIIPAPTNQTQGETLVQKNQGEVPAPRSEKYQEGMEAHPKSIDTAVGPLPADLWTLIGKTPPPPQEYPGARFEKDFTEGNQKADSSDAVKQAIHAAERPPQQGTPSQKLERRRPAAHHGSSPEGPATGTEFGDKAPIQRLTDTTAGSETEASPAQETGPDPENPPDIEALARQVYPEIRRRLALEWERTRRGH